MNPLFSRLKTESRVNKNFDSEYLAVHSSVLFDGNVLSSHSTPERRRKNQFFQHFKTEFQCP